MKWGGRSTASDPPPVFSDHAHSPSLAIDDGSALQSILLESA